MSGKLFEKVSSKGARCQHLDYAGRQCKNQAMRQFNIHTDNGIYEHDELSWVKTWLCKKHVPFVDGGERK